jgi:hypothetical protein
MTRALHISAVTQESQEPACSLIHAIGTVTAFLLSRHEWPSTPISSLPSLLTHPPSRLAEAGLI